MIYTSESLLEAAKNAVPKAELVILRIHRTKNMIIVDIVVGMNALQIKTGSLSRSDRIAKYN